MGIRTTPFLFSHLEYYLRRCGGVGDNVKQIRGDFKVEQIACPTQMKIRQGRVGD